MNDPVKVFLSQAGRKGGRARAKKLTAAQRKASATKASHARESYKRKNAA